MGKLIGGFIAGLIFTGIVAWFMMPSLMFQEQVSPFGFEETIARIQHNIVKNPNGWALSGLRDPAKAIQADGGNVLPVTMIEACSTKYSAPILKTDNRRYLSILMPCKISVYKKNDGKVYIGNMNSGLMGMMFGPLVGDIMGEVAKDQKSFLTFDPNTPAPQIILPKAPAGGAAGGGGGGGC
ncbi:MAG: DUF302 domain-containing protein [Hydrogenophilaceae bacterium]|nr:DUF302 domain-containing protein [Hydrogenophilaceae bacterium]